MTICAVADGNCLGGLVRHHDDYNKPKETRLLCRRHHSLWHREHGHAPGWKPSRQSGTKMVEIGFTLPSVMAADLRRVAIQEGRSVSAIVRDLIRADLAKVAA